MDHPRTFRPRTFRLIGFLAAVVVAVSCSSAPDDAPASTAGSASGPWSFVGDNGEELQLPADPERIVMWEEAAVTLMDFGVRPVGIFGQSEGVSLQESPLFEGLDMTGIESVGSICAEINYEALAALDPDLIIAQQWGSYEKYPPNCFLNFKQLETVEAIAPVLALQSERPATDVLDRYVELAGSLGADLESPEVSAKRDRFETAVKRLKAAVADRPEITVVGMTGAQDGGGQVAHPGGFPDLQALEDDFGVRFVDPPDHNGYWKPLSPEEVDSYLGDVMLFDSRPGLPSIAELADQNDLWARMPAVAADQVVPWYVPGSSSYTQYAEALERLAAEIEDAQDVA